jgi:hypothetical protein
MDVRGGGAAHDDRRVANDDDVSWRLLPLKALFYWFALCPVLVLCTLLVARHL